MKINVAAIAFFSVCLTIPVFGQQARLEGNIYEIVKDKEVPVRGVKVISPDGQSQETDSKGHFVINFPNSARPGKATRIEVSRSGWVVRDPLFGECTTKDSARNVELLKIIIVPKGSPLALEPKQLSKVIARWADERVKLRGQVNALGQQLDEYAFLREYAEKYGVTLDQFKDAADRWAKIKESDDKEERARKEYWQKNYESAARLAREAGDAAVEELDRLKNEQIVVGHNAVRRYRLEGNSFYAQYKFREAATVYYKIENLFVTRKIAKEDFLEEWAETKNLLGNAKQELGTRVEGKESRLLLGEAAEAFREVLNVITREQLPQLWATTQNNLGTALKSQGERAEGADGVRLLGEAVEAYRKALKAIMHEQLPQLWAIIQNNLGTALGSQGERAEGADGARLFGEAVQAFREALQAFTHKEQRATAQNNLGIVLRSQGERVAGADGVRLLGEAVQAHREALQAFTHEQQRAMTQNYLGIALRSQGERAVGTDGVRLFEEATQTLREALKVYTLNQLPQQRAMTQNNLGFALMSQGERVEGADGVRLLGEAVQAFREALQVYTREQLPQQWAMTQNNLGIALRSQGERAAGADGVRLFGEAVQAYREALQVYTHERLPQQWAMTQNNLGSALSLQGKRLKGVAGVRLLGEAVQAIRETLKVYTREQLPQQWAGTQNNLGNALRSQGELAEEADGTRWLEEAVQAYREALKVRTQEQLPQQWVVTQYNLGKAQFLLKNWKDAALCFEAVFALYPFVEETYQFLVMIYHERLFEYEKAFALHKKLLSQFPQERSVLSDFAETHFTTGRYDECEKRIIELLANSEIPASTKTALRAIEIADLLALGQAKEIPIKLEALLAEVSQQPAAFKVDWSFSGTRHFIGQNEKLSAYREWLGTLFDALAGKDRETILRSLREALAQFPK